MTADERKQTGSFTVALYNPALLKKEDLVRGFVARQPLLERLIGDLRRETPENSPQHHLIIGQRGLGKTTLLRRIAFAVEDDSGLAATWIPLVFPEEQYNVAGLGDFWLNCVDALSDALDRSDDRAASQALDSRVETLPGADPDRAVAAMNLLLSEAGRLGRRILLLVDNIDIVLDRLNKDEDWELRRVLSTERRLHVMGASSRILEAVYEYGKPFYDFFQVHELKGFDDQETFSTLTHLADGSDNPDVSRLVREQPGRIKALRLLTGGNPRTLVLLFKVLAQGPEGDVQRDLEQLLDEYTALYKARFEELPPQAQQVVDAMAIHWDPITAADLADRLQPITVSQISAQLNRLKDFGVVEETAWFGSKKKAFQIAERFFNIWYLMRASRRVRRRLLWLVKFLEIWFDREELSARARAFLERDPEKMGRERYAEMAMAYSEAVSDRHLRRSLESAGLHAVLDDGVRRLIDFSDLPQELQDKKVRIEQLRDLRETVCRMNLGDGIVPADLWRLLGGSPYFSLMEKARMAEQLPSLPMTSVRELFEKLRRFEQELLLTYRTHTQDVARIYDALAGGELADVYDYENAIAVAKRHNLHSLPYIAIASRVNTRLHRQPLSESESGRAEIALRAMTREQGFEPLAWHGLGNLMAHHLKRYEEAEQAYRRAIDLAPNDSYPWNSLGMLLENSLKRYSEAEHAYRRAIDIDPNYAPPWNNLGNLLRDHLKQYEKAEQAYRRAIELAPNDFFPWRNLGNLLREQPNRHEEAEQAYRHAIELDPRDSISWNDLGNLLGFQLKRYDEAEQAYNRAIELDAGFAIAWSNLGMLRERLNRYDEAEQAYRRAIELDPNSSDTWNNLGILLQWNLNRYNEAEESYRNAIELDTHYSHPWNNLGVLLQDHLKRYDEAEKAYRRAIELDSQSAYAWSNLGRLMDLLLVQSQEAAEAYLHAFEIDATRFSDLERFIRKSSRLSEQSIELTGLLRLAERALTVAPANPEIQFLLARLLTLAGNWHEASRLLEQAATSESVFFDTEFFKAAMKTGHLDDVIDILKRTGLNDRWRPLYEALRAAQVGTVAYLNTVAPEVRMAATYILDELVPGLSAGAVK